MKILFERDMVPFNSSSSHVILKFKDKNKVPKDIDSDCYGWDDFIFACKEYKKKYIKAQLFCVYSDNYKEDDVEIFIKCYNQCGFNELLGEIDNSDECFSSKVDHGSIFSFPNRQIHIYSNNKMDCIWDIEYIKDAIKEILKDEYVIFGGNDNSSNNYSDGYQKDYTWLKDVKQINFFNLGDYVSRKDGNVWVLTNNRGGILLITFNEEKESILSIPYLVDVQITDKCNIGCKYCYRGCTQTGEEANKYKVYQLKDALFRIGVSNIVYGGGDVSTYKSIRNIGHVSRCERYNTYSTTINYHTALKLNKSHELYLLCMNYDGIGISIPNDISDTDLKDMVKLNKELSYVTKSEIVFQIIPELFTVEELKRYFKICEGVTTNLLGYKVFKNGGNQIYLDEEKLSIIKQFFNKMEYENQLSLCDAEFVNKYKSFLIDCGVIESSIKKQDGICTCFIDLVHDKMYLSSYSDVYVDFNFQELYTLYGRSGANHSNYSYFPIDIEKFKKYFIEKRKELLKLAKLID